MRCPEAVDTAEIGSLEASESLIPFSEASELDQETEQKNTNVLDAHTRTNQILPYQAKRAGTGNVSGSDCDEFYRTLACVAKTPLHKEKSRREIFKHCKNLLCPKCYPSAAARIANRVDRRHKQIRALYLKRGDHIGRDKHWAFSLDPELYPLEFYERDGGKEAFALVNTLESHYSKDGHYGGENTLHLWRKKHEADLSECRKKNCHREHIWVFGGHMHYTGVGFFDNELMAERSVYGIGPDGKHKYAFIMERIEDQGERNIYATISYEQTHSAVLVKRSTNRMAKNFRYVGLFQDRVTKRTSTKKEYRPVPCDINGCKADLHSFRGVFVDGIGMEPDSHLDMDEGIYYQKVEVVTYELVKKELHQTFLLRPPKLKYCGRGEVNDVKEDDNPDLPWHGPSGDDRRAENRGRG